MALLRPFLDPLSSYGFMREGLVAAIVVGLVSAVLSCLLVVRHQALLGDAISHAVLLGVAVGFLAAGTGGVLPGALAIAVLTGVAITYLERNTPIQLDAAMGICFTTTFALGLAIISIVQPRGIDLFHILFGNIIGLRRSDLVLTVVAGFAILLVVLVLFRWLHVWSFDPGLADALGVPLRVVEYTFTALLSAAVVVAMNAVGLLLVVAMLIIPGAAALLLTSRLSNMMFVASSIGVLSSVAGLYGSYYANVASGPAIVLTTAACFVVILLLAPRHGLLARPWKRHRRLGRLATEELLAWIAASEEAVRRTDVRAIASRLTLPVRILNRSLRRLQREGSVDVQGGAIVLTEHGHQRARRPPRNLEDASGQAPGRMLGMPASATIGAGDDSQEIAVTDGCSTLALADAPAGLSAQVQAVELPRGDGGDPSITLGLRIGALVRVLAGANGHQLIEIDGGRPVAVDRAVGQRVRLGSIAGGSATA